MRWSSGKPAPITVPRVGPKGRPGPSAAEDPGITAAAVGQGAGDRVEDGGGDRRDPRYQAEVRHLVRRVDVLDLKCEQDPGHADVQRVEGAVADDQQGAGRAMALVRVAPSAPWPVLPGEQRATAPSWAGAGAVAGTSAGRCRCRCGSRWRWRCRRSCGEGCAPPCRDERRRDGALRGGGTTGHAPRAGTHRSRGCDEVARLQLHVPMTRVITVQHLISVIRQTWGACVLERCHGND